ncbi:DUF4374 domain-containing protein [Membranihabitans maritimus]|uniref:DUF4374 domain-containing protein n=1 Tax=Membranihabitans maritimus TaxID=2904244 RepID=UPI001F29EEE9|nr:DUF4374 domain-containing protein [Membranihabitans maritimus]
MKFSNRLLLSVIGISLLGWACDKEDPIEPGEEGDPTGSSSKYIIASSPIASEGVADYLLTSDDLTEGTVSTVGNGKEQDGTYRYYVTNKNKFFSLLYGQGNPGAVTTYDLSSSGELNELSDFQSETVQAFAAVKDDILMAKIPRSGDENALWYRLNTESIEIVDDGQINVVELAGNGERAHFTWLTQVGEKVFAPYMSIKGCCDDIFGTQYPDSAWIAVYSYPDMQLEKVITDDRTSFIGRYFTSGIEEVETGDVYAFSSGVATNSGQNTSSKPCAITRIPNGTTEFDSDYFFNISEASDGYYLTTKTYVGNGKFVLTMHKEEEKGAYTVGKEFAIADVYNQTFTWVTGTPAPEDIQLVTQRNNYSPLDGQFAYVGITTDESSYIYEIDAINATARQGLEVEGGQITAISKLESN